jgi:predicted RNase H-like HicB family nuclease
LSRSADAKSNKPEFDFLELPEHSLRMVFKAIVRPAEEGGFWAEVPALPGCVSQGETQEELLENLKEAATGWLEASQDEGELSAGSEVLEFAL